MTKYTDDDVKHIFTRYFRDGDTISLISRDLSIPRGSIYTMLKSKRLLDDFSELVNHNALAGDIDGEVIEENIRLAKQKQRLLDRNRIERKSFREFARSDNMLLSLHEELLSIFEEKNLSRTTVDHSTTLDGDGDPCGVIQLSDLHFNEIIRDLDTNRYDTKIASKRLYKLCRRAIDTFLPQGVTRVAVFMTGDLVNSDRRISEITEAATSRVNAMFIAVDIIQQFILALNEHFTVTVASITGNESRIKEFIDYSDFLASDSYDIAIHTMLARLFNGSESVTFLRVHNPLESVVEVNGTNFLLVHGHCHKGLATDTKIENEVERIKARYAAHGVAIDYVLCGHIHKANVSDLYARSSGLPGNNAFSERALNLTGRSSQNIFLVYPNKSIDAIKVDLQEYGEEMFAYDESLESYNNPRKGDGNVIIQSVLV